MLEIGIEDDGKIVLSGRFDAAQAPKASQVFDELEEPRTVDLGQLEYISSMGLAILLKTQKRLKGSSGAGLRLVNVNKHIHDIFRYSGFHHVFEIESAG